MCKLGFKLRILVDFFLGQGLNKLHKHSNVEGLSPMSLPTVCFLTLQLI